MKSIVLFFLLSCLWLIELKAQPDCCGSYQKQIEGLFNDCQYSLAYQKLNRMLQNCDKCEGTANSWRSRIQQCLNDANASGCPCRSTGSTVVEVEQDFCPMVYVQGGTFTMGCTAEQGSDCDDDEKPAHKVTVGNHSIGKYEVTQAQWREIMGASPSYFKDCDNCPMEQVSYDDIQTFLQKLNQKYPGRNYRLPTEAEWEYAARGGNKKDGTKYSGSNNIENVAWYSSNSGSKTHPVGQKSPNGLGIYDMSGNVWEWCSDWFKGYPGSTGVTDNTGSSRVLRGGSWYFDARLSRTSVRSYDSPSDRLSNFGFRLSRTE